MDVAGASCAEMEAAVVSAIALELGVSEDSVVVTLDGCRRLADIPEHHRFGRRLAEWSFSYSVIVEASAVTSVEEDLLTIALDPENFTSILSDSLIAEGVAEVNATAVTVQVVIANLTITSTTTTNTTTTTTTTNTTASTTTTTTTTNTTTSMTTTTTTTMTTTSTTIVTPGSPTIASVTESGLGEVTIEVNEVSDTGGSPVLGYGCTAVESDVYGTSNSTVVVISGLSPSTEYSVRCQATNSVGSSSLGVARNITTSDVPSAPSIMEVAVTGDGQLTVYLSEPLDLGGAETMAYVCNDVTGTDEAGTTSVDGVVFVVFEGLTPGTAYSFTCLATNWLGNSSASTSSVAVVAKAAPLGPSLDCVVPMDGSVEIQVSDLNVGEEYAAVTSITCSVSLDESSTNAQELATGYDSLEKFGTDAEILQFGASGSQLYSGNSSYSLFLLQDRPVVTSGATLDTVVLEFDYLITGCPSDGNVTLGIGFGNSSSIRSISSIVASRTLSDNSMGPECDGTTTFGSGYIDVSGLARPMGEYDYFALVVLNAGRSMHLRPGTLQVEWSYTHYEVVNDKVTVTGISNLEEFSVSCQARSVAGITTTTFTESLVTGTALTVVYSFVTATGTVADLDATTIRTEVASWCSVPLSYVVLDAPFDGCPNWRRLQDEADVEVSVMTEGASDENLDSLTETLTNLADSTTFAETIGAETVTVVELPVLQAEEFLDSTLSSLSVVSGGNEMVLVPQFDGDVQTYDVNVTSLEFEVTGVANSALSSVTVDVEPDSSTFTVTTVAPEFLAVLVTVVARDRSSTTYTLRVYFQPIQCVSCVSGTCDFFQGLCTCASDWSGEYCDTYCPGDEPCNGLGTCVEGEGCVCDVTYGNATCLTRVCPECQQNGTCIPGEQTLTSTWTCDCPYPYTGMECAEQLCPDDCSSAGTCNSESGLCTCFVGYSGISCNETDPVLSLEPLSKTIEISFVFGMDGYTISDEGPQPTYRSFDFYGPDFLEGLYLIVQRARNSSVLEMRDDHISWIEELQGLYPDDFPFNSDISYAYLDSFFRSYDGSYGGDLGTDGTNFDGNVLWTRVRLRTNRLTTASATDLEPLWEEWKNFVDQQNGQLHGDLQFLMIASAWTRVYLELSIVSSTLTSLALSVGITLVSMIIFTGNLLIALYTIITTTLTLCTLFGFTFSILQWEFGPIEAIGMVAFVGVSVDYILHLGHCYCHSEQTNRREIVTNTLGNVGFVVVGGAVTTAGASCFLWACEIYFFVQLGILLFANTVICCFFSLFFMASLLIIGGPLGNCCSVGGTIRYILSVKRWLSS